MISNPLIDLSNLETQTAQNTQNIQTNTSNISALASKTTPKIAEITFNSGYINNGRTRLAVVGNIYIFMFDFKKTNTTSGWQTVLTTNVDSCVGCNFRVANTNGTAVMRDCQFLGNNLLIYFESEDNNRSFVGSCVSYST